MDSVKMAERIELWPLDKLNPYARNPRTHTPEQVAKVAASIAEFGFTNPILVDADQGIIAGHCRLMAAQKLGLKTVPVIELTHLSEAQKRAYIIADNRLALDAGWDIEKLMGGDMADCTWTDPPYNVNYGEKAEMLDKYQKGHRNTSRILNDNMDSAEFYEFLHTAFTNVYAVSKPGAAVPVSTCHRVSSGGRTPLSWAAPTITGSMSLSSTAGRIRERIAGSVVGIRRPSRSSRAHPSSR